jgi:two-component system, OmpR family, sensor histidine kinase MprB
VTKTLRARLVLVLGAVVAAACVVLVTFAVLGSAVLLRREQGRTLQSVAAEQCEGVSSEARERRVGLESAARVYFKEGQVAGIRLELTDRNRAVLVWNGELDGWGTGQGRFRVRSVACGDGFVMRAIARDVLTEPAVRRVGGILLAALPIALAIGTALGGIAIAKALRPLDDLEQAAERLTATSPLALGVGARPLEIARLERAFDALLERLGAALARERRFTQEASHEIRTPLTAVRARIERLASAATAEQRGDHVAAALRELQSLETLVEALLLLARAEDAPMPRAPVNLCDLARGVAHRQRLVDGSAVLPVEVDAPDEILVRGSEELLERAIGNIVENARKFAGASGRIRLRVSAGSGRGVILVADDGPGIAAATRTQVFERFYRDPSQRQASNGAGLGLAVVRAIVARHGGTVSADRSEFGGAELRLDLPLLI